MERLGNSLLGLFFYANIDKHYAKFIESNSGDEGARFTGQNYFDLDRRDIADLFFIKLGAVAVNGAGAG